MSQTQSGRCLRPSGREWVSQRDNAGALAPGHFHTPRAKAVSSVCGRYEGDRLNEAVRLQSGRVNCGAAQNVRDNMRLRQGEKAERLSRMANDVPNSQVTSVTGRLGSTRSSREPVSALGHQRRSTRVDEDQESLSVKIGFARKDCDVSKYIVEGHSGPDDLVVTEGTLAGLETHRGSAADKEGRI